MLVHLDVLASLSDAAATALKLYVRPVLRDEGAGMTLPDQVRHPCLEVLDDMSFIANNVSFKQVRQSLSVCKKSA
jgi:DNA mismatch repair protein MSH2